MFAPFIELLGGFLLQIRKKNKKNNKKLLLIQKKFLDLFKH